MSTFEGIQGNSKFSKVNLTRDTASNHLEDLLESFLVRSTILTSLLNPEHDPQHFGFRMWGGGGTLVSDESRVMAKRSNPYPRTFKIKA